MPEPYVAVGGTAPAAALDAVPVAGPVPALPLDAVGASAVPGTLPRAVPGLLAPAEGGASLLLGTLP
jgi:hypothetical protein